MGSGFYSERAHHTALEETSAGGKGRIAPQTQLAEALIATASTE